MLLTGVAVHVGGGGTQELCTPVQRCCEPKSALKNVSLLKRGGGNSKAWGREGGMP